ncbi:alpha/beta hydrolase family protein [Kineococcus radiotolerans]|uniref:alpha/beta hydrolase family protein n=1 Tax=Kineococcus radiotolerans TaxID=131568 RepID=UPI0002ED3E7A|nr:alpha/beta hydrolase [Kineococcus radiotolerans]
MLQDVATWTTVLGAAGCAGAALWRAVRSRPHPATRVLLLAAAAVVLAGAVVTSLDGGPRWQVAPLAAAVLLALPAGARSARRGRRGPRVLLGAAAVLAVGAGSVAVRAFPPLRLPVPSGPHPVGVGEIAWAGPATDCPASGLLAQVWYPAAAAGGDPGPYLGRDRDEARRVSAALADAFGVPPVLLREAAVGRGRAVPGTPVAAGRFPVVLFSPGNLGVRRQNSAWATDLASRGRVVVALDHPCDSAVVVGPEGEAVTSTAGGSGDDARDQADADRRVGVRAQQLRSALDELARRDSADRLLGGHLDLGAVAAAGHSLGGAAALRAAAQDERVDAVVDLDGFPRGADGLDVPVLVLVAGRGTGDPGADARYARAVEAVTAGSPDARVVEVAGASHLTFTDAPLFLPPLPGLVGSLGREGAVAATARATEEFLADVLGPR